MSLLSTEISSNPDGSMSYDDIIHHVRSTLADVCIRAASDRFGIFRLLNRVVFLFQEPICFAFAKRDQTSYIIDKYSIGDVLYQHSFREALNELNVDPKTNVCAAESISDYAVPLFSADKPDAKTDFAIIAFRISRDPESPNAKQQRVGYVPIRRDEDYGIMLQKLFTPFGSALSKLGLERHINANFHEMWTKSSLIRAELDKPEEFFPRGAEEQLEIADIVAKYNSKANREGGRVQGPTSFTSVAELFEAEMKELLLSPLIKNNDNLVSNVLITQKTFGRNTTRFNAYYYDSSVFVSALQRQQFAQSLAIMSREKFTKFFDREIDEWFWMQVKHSNADALLRVLDRKPSKGLRLFPEYVLMSGVSIVNRNPFARGDIGWIDSSLMSEEEKKSENQRIVVLHYLFQMMAPGIVEPSLLTLPIRVSGATWLSATFVVSGFRGKYGLVDSDEFQKRFLFYHSIMRRFERRFRSKSKDCYIGAVFDIFADHVRALRKRVSKLKPQTAPLKLDFGLLNRRTSALCRLYPYELIHFGPRGLEDNKEVMEYYHAAEAIGKVCDVTVFLRPNPYFDRLLLRNFLDPAKDVAKPISDFIHAEIGIHETRQNLYLLPLQKAP
jgi:hypothetical protein